MGCIDQSAQLLIGVGWDVGKEGIGAEEVLNAIAVIRTLIETGVLQYRAIYIAPAPRALI